MGVLKYKIFRDIWHQKGRTLQVMAIIGIGAAAIGMILTTRNLVVPGMQAGWRQFSAPMAFIFVDPAVPQSLVDELTHMKGVASIEGLNTATIEWRVNPNDEWRQGGITARADYEDMKMNKLELVEGDWPHDDELLIGQGDDQYFKIPKNGDVYFRINDKVSKVHIDGVLYNQFQQPAYFGGTAQFYADLEKYDQLVGNRDYGQLLVRADFPYNEDKVEDLSETIQDRLEKSNRTAGYFVTDPDKHFFQDTMDGLFFMLGVLGAISLILGLLLVYNTISNIILSQVDQIGIMKAIGARTGHVARFFLIVVIIYGFLAFACSLPLTIFGGWAISSWLVSSFGADPGEFQVNRQAVLVVSIIALIAPMLAALLPIWSASHTTVREAISTYGLSTNTGFVEKMFAQAKRVSRLVIVTISNTFRHKGRVVLLEIALVVSGLVFMTILSVRDAVTYTIRDVLFAILNANITLTFEDPQRIPNIEKLTMEYPGIKAVEMWGGMGGTIRPRGQEAKETDEQVGLLGVPLPTQLYGYQIREGRWLDANDSYALVLNEKLAEDAGVKVGDWVTVKYGEKNERDYQIVGLTFDPILTTLGAVPRQVLLEDIGEVDRASSVWIQTEKEGLPYEADLAKELREYYKEHNVKVSAQRGAFGGFGGDSTTETGNVLINQFNFLIILLAIMAVLIGAVGSIALSGAISLSVMERKREIGVMRAIGASSWSISKLFIGEGLILGLLSWLIAIPISIFTGRLMVYVLGNAFNIDFIYNYTPTGQLMWLVIITILSILASWLPARGATKISVRESLSYQ